MIALMTIQARKGKVLRFSSEPYLDYEPYLILQESEYYIGESGALPGQEFPTPREPTFALVGQAADLVTTILHSKAELHIVYEKTPILIAKGILNELALELDGTITGRVSKTSEALKLHPEPNRLINQTTFPRTASYGTVTGNPLALSIGDDAIGKFAPVVIGRPGATTSDVVKGYTNEGAIPGSPAYLVESTGNVYDTDQVWLIASHPVMATEVVLFNKNRSDGDDADRLLADALVGTVSVGQDNLGLPFSYVTVDTGIAPLATYMSKGDQFYVKWIDSSGEPVTGGLHNPYGTGPLRGAGDVLRYAADVTGLLWEPTKQSILGVWNELKIDTYINEPINMWTWALQNIISFLPAISSVNADGVWIVPFPRSYSDQAACRFTLTELDELAIPMTFTSAENLATSVVVSYAPAEHIPSGWAKQTSVTSDTDSTLKNNLTALGEKVIYFELPVVYDDGTASFITKWLGEWWGSTWAYATYKIPVWAKLPKLGDLIWLPQFTTAGVIYDWKVDATNVLEISIIFKLR